MTEDNGKGKGKLEERRVECGNEGFDRCHSYGIRRGGEGLFGRWINKNVGIARTGTDVVGIIMDGREGRDEEKGSVIGL